MSDNSFDSDAEFWQQLDLVSFTQKPHLQAVSDESNDLGDLKLPGEMLGEPPTTETARTTAKTTATPRTELADTAAKPTRFHRRLERSVTIIEEAKSVEATNAALIVKMTAQVSAK
jgi:hypothetical protein